MAVGSAAARPVRALRAVGDAFATRRASAVAAGAALTPGGFPPPHRTNGLAITQVLRWNHSSAICAGLLPSTPGRSVKRSTDGMYT